MKDYFADIDFKSVTGVTRCNAQSISHKNNTLCTAEFVTPSNNATCDRGNTNDQISNTLSHPVTPNRTQGVIQETAENKAVTPVTPITPSKKQSLYLYGLYEERAAILEYDAELPRHEAEYIAYKEILEHYITENYPSIKAEIESIIYQPTVN